MASSLTLSAVDFAWPDGTPAFTGLTATLPAGLTSLVGANGAGKSTLLRLLAGRLRPTAGSISGVGVAGYVPQHPQADPGATLGETLGVGAQCCGALLDVTNDRHDLEARQVLPLAGLVRPSVAGYAQRRKHQRRCVLAPDVVQVLEERERYYALAHTHLCPKGAALDAAEVRHGQRCERTGRVFAPGHSNPAQKLV